MVSKLKEEAAAFINAAGFECSPQDIVCVSGYWKKEDCHRWWVNYGKHYLGCWLPLTKFVRECKENGGATIDQYNQEVDPKYPPYGQSLEKACTD